MTIASVLSGCETSSPVVEDGLSGAPDQFAAMRQPCTQRASRIATPVTILDELRTGGGPILTLSAGEASYTCRLEADGSVTVFSEFAN